MKDEYIVLNNLALFLKQGYAIEDILTICALDDQGHKIEKINQGLQSGLTLEEAIINSGFNATFVEYFKFYCLDNSIADALLSSLTIVSKIDETINKLKKQLTYPLVLIIFLIGFSFFVVYGLLPSVNQLFFEFNIEPGLLTKIVFWLFKIIPIIIIVSILLLLLMAAVAIYAIKKQYFKLLDQLVSKVFVIRNLIRKYYSIKFALYYNQLLINGYDTTNIIITLYQKITDSDIKMIIYEIYIKVLQGEGLDKIVSDFIYFEPLFISCFKLLLYDNQPDKSLDHYLQLSLDNLNRQVSLIMKYIVVFVYLFTALFVIVVYIAIIIPMMSVINTL